MLDYEAEREIERDINNAVKWYLSSSYGYYVKGDTILTDPYFDQLAVRLRRVWDTINHPHKDLITEDDLWCGSLLLAEEKYPEDIIQEFERAKKELENKQ